MRGVPSCDITRCERSPAPFDVPPDNTNLVVDALIKANKDFDLLMLPNRGHGYGSMSNYMTRRRWDYFV